MTKKKEIKIQDKIEREYVIPLRKKYQKTPKHKRTPKAVKTIKEFLVKHMKIYDRNLNKIKLDRYLNEFLWFRGIKNPPSKIKIKAIKEKNKEGIENVRVELSEIPNKLRFKKLREEKREKLGEESAKKKKKEKEEVEKKEEPEKEDEKKIEEKEKKAAVVEAGKEIEKKAAKQIKHQTEARTKQPKRQQRKALNK